MTRVTTANPLFRTPGNRSRTPLENLLNHYKNNNNNTRAFLTKLLANGKTPNQIKKKIKGFGNLMVKVSEYKKNLSRPTPNPLASKNANNTKRRRHGGGLGAMGAAGELVRAFF